MSNTLVKQNPISDALTLVIKENLGTNLLGTTNALIDGAIHLDQTSDAIKISIDEDLKIPLLIHYVPDGGQDPIPIEIFVKDSVRANIVEYIDTNHEGALEPKVLVKLDKNSSVNYFRNAGGKNNNDINQILNVKLKAHANFQLFDINSSMANSKKETSIMLDEEGGKIRFFGLDELYENARTENNLVVSHNAPNTTSEQLFRGIYDDDSNGTFFGKVIVKDNASSCSANQHYKAMIVSDNANANVMPQMEVNNDDISASHGASIGELDKNALFYLKSRGISEHLAKAMLVGCLAKEILNHLPHKDIKSLLTSSCQFKSEGIDE